MDDPPTLERRIKAAMELAGLDYDTLAERINTQNYGASTLRNIANPNHPREARFADLIVIARACRVSEAFFRVDFLELEEPSLRAEVSRLRADLEELSLAFLRQSGEPPADAGEDLPEGPPGDDPR